jgi:hypothetical protein
MAERVMPVGSHAVFGPQSEEDGIYFYCVEEYLLLSDWLRTSGVISYGR